MKTRPPRDHHEMRLQTSDFTTAIDFLQNSGGHFFLLPDDDISKTKTSCRYDQRMKKRPSGYSAPAWRPPFDSSIRQPLRLNVETPLEHISWQEVTLFYFVLCECTGIMNHNSRAMNSDLVMDRRNLGNHINHIMDGPERITNNQRAMDHLERNPRAGPSGMPAISKLAFDHRSRRKFDRDDTHLKPFQGS
mmetsp:Transcript_6795/g.11985  ORF Transcript_6795/g.11985 Transcript_6795/m.11985 type:complete len:191 (-) Transcript_6795:272-844(-)